MVIGNLADPLFPALVRGAEDAAWLRNYLLITMSSGDQVERERELLTALRSRRVDGILLVAANDRHSGHIRAIKESGIPVVCVDREIAGLGLDCVVVDNAAAARECVAHLIAAGHRRIGMLNGTTDVAIARERMAGYRKALEDAGLPFDESLTEHAAFDVEQGYHAGRRLLAHPAVRPLSSRRHSRSRSVCCARSGKPTCVVRRTSRSPFSTTRSGAKWQGLQLTAVRTASV